MDDADQCPTRIGYSNELKPFLTVKTSQGLGGRRFGNREWVYCALLPALETLGVHCRSVPMQLAYCRLGEQEGQLLLRIGYEDVEASLAERARR